MPRILHLIETLGHGGAEEQLALTVQALDRKRFKSFVMMLGGERPLARRIEASGIPVFDLWIPRRRAALPLAMARALQIARRIEPDLIHSSLFEADLLAGLLGKTLGIPVVTTLCTVGGVDQQLLDNPNTNLLKHRAMTELWGFALRSDRSIIAISNAVKQAAVANYRVDPERIEVVYRAFVPSPTPPTREPRLEGNPSILTVGRLVPEKGQKYLIEAMPEVLRALPGARLHIAGKGWLEPELRALVRKLELQESVHFLGYRSDARDLMRRSDVFVFPSLWEGLGVALVEAAGLGCAAIAANVGPLPEIIEHDRTGLLVEPRDPRSLASAIVRLGQSESLRAEFGRAATKSVAERFRVDRIVPRIERIYQQTLDSRRLRPSAIGG